MTQILGALNQLGDITTYTDLGSKVTIICSQFLRSLQHDGWIYKWKGSIDCYMKSDYFKDIIQSGFLQEQKQ